MRNLLTRKESLEWGLAILIVLVGMLIWRVVSSPAIASERFADPLVDIDCG
jgi:hypothetical protein